MWFAMLFLDEHLKGFLREVNTVSDKAFTNETDYVHMLLGQLDILHTREPVVISRAKDYINYLKTSPHRKTTLESFLHEFGLNTEEGIAIMCLAEALLRIPDNHTQDLLIRDSLKDTHFESHIRKGSFNIINTASMGLVLSGKVLNLGHTGKPSKYQPPLQHLLKKMGEPVVRKALIKAMQMMGSHFVLGETIDLALLNAHKYEKLGFSFSFDMLGEGARSSKQAWDYFEQYLGVISAIGKTVETHLPLFRRKGISVKLSALHPRFELLHLNELQTELLPKLRDIASHVIEHNISMTIDAEESYRLDLTLILYEMLMQDTKFRSYEGIGLAVQAYQKRAWGVLDSLIDLSQNYHHLIPVRLVKGAYWDSEIKRAQMLGLDSYPVFTKKIHTDISYLACAKKAFDHPKHIYPQFATHNANTVTAILEMATHKNYEFQRLHGMGELLYEHLYSDLREIPHCRIYAPVGEYRDLLPYLIRRLLENGSSTSFVHQLGDQTIGSEQLTQSPLSEAKKSHCQTTMPMPRDIFTSSYARPNSQGIDIGNMAQCRHVYKGIQPKFTKVWKAMPLIGNEILPLSQGEIRFQPANHAQQLGTIQWATKELVDTAVTKAHQFFPTWSHTPPAERAVLLQRVAEMIENYRHELLGLLMMEAGKTLQDATSEIREAFDFCQYYSAIIRKNFVNPEKLPGYTGEQNELSLHGRGVFACISPWNFPLAIFVGQITAALGAGNCVIAKPASQTPFIAYTMIKLMHEAGIPKDALHLLPGSGSDIGTPLIEDPRIMGVAFTGSSATAQFINRTLANRTGSIIPFIAETGGQNAMIIDSTALVETAVDDVLLSAFGSAGQRCSALRVLFIQDDIADHFLDLLQGAMMTLHIGQPEHLNTDIGPVIDKAARDKLEAHISFMHEKASFIAAVPLASNLATTGHFVAPHAFLLKDMSLLTEEVFGPILHVIRYKAGTLPTVIDTINKTGYGLTLGVQTRLESTIDYVRKHAHVGNLYINRSMIGAVVGVQPFGGEGLSGTGPKAGGPHYMLRFATERTYTENIAAIGGNIPLMMEVDRS